MINLAMALSKYELQKKCFLRCKLDRRTENLKTEAGNWCTLFETRHSPEASMLHEQNDLFKNSIKYLEVNCDFFYTIVLETCLIN